MVYLDNNSTTKLDPRVLEKMMPFLKDQFANGSSDHSFGVAVNQQVKEAKNYVANLIGSQSNEITFTSGATESISLAIKGIAEQYVNKGKHIITAATEHLVVLDTCRNLESKDFDITYLPVREDIRNTQSESSTHRFL